MIKPLFMVIVAAAALLGIIYALLLGCDDDWCTWYDWQVERRLERGTLPEDESTVPVTQIFPDKVIYTTDMNEGKSKYEADCRERGGTFKECGSPCPASAEVCIQVCAYTCEL